MQDEILTGRGKVFGKSEACFERGEQWNRGAVGPVQMPNPLEMWNPWLALSAQTALLGWEAQQVIALRLVRIAGGGARGRAETQRMMSEKFAAAVEAQAAVTASAIEGGADHRAGKKLLDVYGKRVRANRRRLSR
jgi:hypothetical protein